MSQFLARCRVPIEDLGRLRLPARRMRFADGYVRVGLTPDRLQYVMTLEDREGGVIPHPSREAAIEKAHRMGLAICLRLLEYNRQYEPGMVTG